LNRISPVFGELAHSREKAAIAGNPSWPSKRSKLLSISAGSFNGCAVRSSGLRGGAKGTQSRTSACASGGSGVSWTPSRSAASAISTPGPSETIITARRRERGSRPRVQAYAILKNPVALWTHDGSRPRVQAYAISIRSSGVTARSTPSWRKAAS